MGITLAIFNLSGNMPVLRDKFIIWVKGSIIYAIVSFTSLVDMSSATTDFGFEFVHYIQDMGMLNAFQKHTIWDRIFQIFRITFARLGDILAGSNANFGKIIIK